MGSTLAYANVVHSKRMWVFPDYILGMRSSGRDITEITSDRLKQSIFFIILLDIVLLAGIWFVYRNVKREIILAQLKSDFVSNVSHELRTPLSLIRMYSETLELGRVRDEGKKQEYYKNISQEAERLTHLINNILNFSRLESGKKEYNFSSTDINALITTVYETYKDSVLEKGFTFELKLSEESIIKNIDEAAMSESLINLIDNAVKYSEDQKYIAIHSKIDQDTILIEVEDHGTGIAAEQQQKIFEKFYRISTGLVHNTKGSGLGLALVKHNIEAHNGEVILKSQPGNGSRFILKIPIDRS
jgi:signal transduction histidine kinase